LYAAADPPFGVTIGILVSTFAGGGRVLAIYSSIRFKSYIQGYIE
jgi:hypothetical protein